MFLFLLVALPIFLATIYLCTGKDETAADTPVHEKASHQIKLTRNGFTCDLDESNYQINLKKINQEKIQLQQLEAKKTNEQREKKTIDAKEREEKGRIALIELGKLAQQNKDEKEELELVFEAPKPDNAALDFFIELEKPQQNDEPEVETEITSAITESIIGDVLGASIGLPAPAFELATTLKDAVSDSPKPITTRPTKRKRKGMGIS